MNTKKLRKLQNCMKEDSPTRTKNLRRKGLYFLFKRWSAPILILYLRESTDTNKATVLACISIDA